MFIKRAAHECYQEAIYLFNKSKMNIISFIVYVSMILSFITPIKVNAIINTSGMIDIKNYSTNPTATQYKVTDSAGLIELANLVNNGNNLLGVSIYLANNIAFDRNTVNNFTGVGRYNPTNTSVNRVFSGTFDGNNYTISGININKGNTTAEADYNSLLFNNISGAVIRNVRISNSIITGRYEIAGICVNCESSTIDNCIVDGTTSITSVNTRAKPINDISVLISNLESGATIITAVNDVAGIVYSCTNSTISNCVNNGVMNGKNLIAGIVSAIIGTSSVVNCVNNSSINCNSYASGICLYNYGGTIESCYNTGDITAREEYVSAISIFNYGEITKCYNTGNLTGLDYVGSLASINLSGNINNSFNTGAISNNSGGSFCGGLIGYNYEGSCKNCYNVGAVTGSSNSGGVIGYNESSTQNVINTYYLSGTNSKGIGSNSSPQAEATVKTSSDMKTNEFAYILNSNNFREDNSKIWTRDDSVNSGYPTFAGNNNAANKLTIINNSSNGSISYNNVSNGNAYVIGSSTVDLTVNPNTNYRLSELVINGVARNNQNGRFIMPNEDTTVSAVFTLPISYSLNLVTNGGILSSEVSIPTEYTVESPDITLPTSSQITRSGYNFEGWYDNAELSGSPVTLIPTGSTGNRTYYAKWSDPLNYSITFVTNEGIISDSYEIPLQYNVTSPDILLPTSSQITRQGYRFAGWYLAPDFSGDPITEITTGTTGNLTLYANWSPLESYSITLVLNGGTLDSNVIVPASYKKDSATIVLPTSGQISRLGYAFEGWYDNAELEGEEVTSIPTGSTGNKVFYARWSAPIDYSIMVNTNGGTVDDGFTIPTQYNVESETIILPGDDGVTREGYVFQGWYTNPDFGGSPITEILKGSTGDINLYARWSTPVAYSINVNLNRGTLDSSISIPGEYTIETPTITLPTAEQVTRMGYTFQGWYLNSDFSGSAVTEIPEGSTGDINLYANWGSPLNYSITLNRNGGTINDDMAVPTQYNVESSTITLPTASDITRDGYNFEGWYDNVAFAGNAITEIPSGSTGDKIYYARWSIPIEYNIAFEVNEGAFNEGVELPDQYNVESAAIILPTASEISRTGFDFAGWYDNPELSGSPITEIPTGSFGDKTFYASWNVLTNDTITLVTNGGTINDGVVVPTEYNRDTPTITLPTGSQITRNGYDFEGWYNNPNFTGGTVAEIPKGSTGDRVLYARWSDPIEYSINYETNGGTIDSSIEFPAQYTVESETIALPTSEQIKRLGYNFEGWYENDDFGGDIVTEIPKGSTGDVTFYAKWSDPLVYTITLETNKGTINSSVSIPSEYTVNSETITLPTESEVTRLGYNFLGWFDNSEFKGDMISEIPTGSTGNKVYYARWSEPIVYSISYEPNGGTLDQGVEIPNQYSITSNTIVLPTANEISRENSKFVGWYTNSEFSGSPITEIPKGSVGNVEIYANWNNLAVYTISVDTNGGVINPSFEIPSTYNSETPTIILPGASDITRSGYEFLGWYNNPNFVGDPITEIPKGSRTNINLYAKWSEPVSYTISVNTNGGTLSSSASIPSTYTEEELPIILPTASEISRSGYNFNGWTIEQNTDRTFMTLKLKDTLEAIVTEIPVGTTGNIIISALWSEVEPAEYSITVDTNGGTLSSSVSIPSTYTEETLPIVLPTASQITREGYTFGGWYNNAEFNGDSIIYIPKGTKGDISLFVKWIKNESPADGGSSNNNNINNSNNGNIKSVNSFNTFGKGVFTGDKVIISIFIFVFISVTIIIINAYVRKKNIK